VVGAVAGHIRRSTAAAAFLDGVNVGAVALMAQIGFVLGRAAFVDPESWTIGIASAVLLFWLRVNATWLIIGGAVVGVLLHALG